MDFHRNNMFLVNVSRVDSNQSNDNGTVERRKTLIAATLRRAAARADDAEHLEALSLLRQHAALDSAAADRAPSAPT